MAQIPNNEFLKVLRLAKEAKGKTGVPISQQLLDALKLKWGPSQLAMQEYFRYELYDPNRFRPEQRQTFAGSSIGKIIWRGLNPPDRWVLVTDKVTFSLIMRAAGFPQPVLYALLDWSGRHIPGVSCFSNADGMAAYLRSEARFPMFAKPCVGQRSVGAASLIGYHAENDVLSLANGDTKSVDDFAAEVSLHRAYLFQELIESSECIRDIGGTGLSTLRVVILFLNQGPKVFRVVWKIPVGGNMADNFWRKGNLLALVDRDSGKVQRVLQSTPEGARHLDAAEPLGQALLGHVPPHYKKALDMCLEASRLFTEFQYQAWDIALTEKGALPLELNQHGSFRTVQLGSDVGILDAEFRSLLHTQNVELSRSKRKAMSTVDDVKRLVRGLTRW